MKRHCSSLPKVLPRAIAVLLASCTAILGLFPCAFVEAATDDSIAKYGMTPIYASSITDGIYTVDVTSSSVYFKIVDCQLEVKGDEMNAVMTISSESYLYIYPGTKEEAEAADVSSYTDHGETENDQYTFTYEVSALNQELPCAAYSKRRKKWYDRMILFEADSLPEGALSFELPDYDFIEKAVTYYEDEHENLSEDEEDTTLTASDPNDPALDPTEPMDVDLDDGEYSIEVSMTGGSGRASISSPTLLTVKDGQAYARIVWSSSYYDYMIVGGKKYMNENDDGGTSTFTIPISDMDRSFPVIGDTTAMEDPVEIDYQLTFYSDSIGSKGLIPQEAAKKVLVAAAILIMIGGIVNHLFKKSRFH